MSYPHFSTDCRWYHGLVRDFPAQRPIITVLCGSTRFYDQFQQSNYDLTMAGHIVLTVGFYPHSKAEHGHGEGVGHDSSEEDALDELHKRKIDLADWVYVLNVGGYIGESTRSEIEYSERIGRPVRYLEPSDASLPDWERELLEKEAAERCPVAQEAPAPLDGRLTDADDYGRDYDAQAHALGLPEVGEAGEPPAPRVWRDKFGQLWSDDGGHLLTMTHDEDGHELHGEYRASISRAKVEHRNSPLTEVLEDPEGGQG